jgi:hypothetical protein
MSRRLQTIHNLFLQSKATVIGNYSNSHVFSRFGYFLTLAPSF